MTTTGNIFELQHGQNFSLIRFFGFIDASTVEKLRPVMARHLPEDCMNLIIDVTRVDFLDSHGVGFFVSLLKRTHRQGGKLCIAGIDGQPASVLQMVGFNSTLVTYCKNAEEAERLFKEETRAAG